MIFDEPITLKSTRKSLKASASTLGLVAGAFSWSGLAQAASEETTSQMMLLPEHYELHENGVVVFKLETGETLSLTPDQYLILEDGLLLITDELAQASLHSLPVMGSVRTDLLSELQLVRASDGSVVKAQANQPVWSGEGDAPRLFEQVAFERFELAQNSSAQDEDCEDNPTNDDDESCLLPLRVTSNDASEGLGLGMFAAPGAMALLGMLMTSDQPAEEEVEDTPAPQPAEFWTDADIADSASTSITGTNVDSFVGYTAASTGAVADPISNFAAGMSNSGTINLSAGGNNYVQLGSAVAKSLGSATYIGADSIDVVTLTSDNVKWGATFTLQMGNGSNSLSAGTNVALSAGGPAINYSGGDDEDTIQIGDDSFKYTSFLHADMGNGINTLSFGNRVAQQGGNVTYIGGNDTDTIIAGVDSFLSFGTGSFTMGDGANSLTLGDHVLITYNISYVGGMDSDSVTFGSESLYWFSPAATFSMGAGSNTLTIGDTAAYDAAGLQYTGGDDDDTITLGSNVVNKGFNLVMDVGAGTNSLSVGATAAFSGGVIDYDGGSGVDTLSFGDNLATGPTGRVEIDLGAGDTAADVVTFAGAVGTGSGSTVTIQNFNFNDDRIVVEAGIAATVGEIVDDGLGNLTWTDSGTNHKLIFAGIGAGGTGVIATSAELAAAII